ncbi:slipin family protein [Microbulbifer guangxiensis]|uniref:slipin family protein n=1 Tax=Microbulbifer guangxiensis TaxID=2904249 RepID=UPI001F3F4B68|nr:slipin family protein [Microbulbifer guangxiensis]
MLLGKVIEVPENHRALLFRDGRFIKLLEAGRLRLPYWHQFSVEMYDLDTLEIERTGLKSMIRSHPELSEFMWRVETNEFQVALIYRDEELYDVLLPDSEVTLWQGRGALRASKYDIRERLVFPDTKLKYLVRKTAQLEPFFQLLELADHEVALLYRDGHLYDILPPATDIVLWDGPASNVRVEKIDLHQSQALPETLARDLRFDLPAALEARVKKLVFLTEVPERHRGLLVVNGREEGWLDPGYYAFWRPGRTIAVSLVDLRLKMVEVSGQEILTRDRVSLRLNLSATYRVVDAARVAEVGGYESHVYRALQLALREAVGTRTLDALLEDKSALNGDVRELLDGDLDAVGVEVIDIGVKDIVLPGDMKSILNRVVEAQKEAEANLIRRREETQAARALHNTAKMMENSPTVMRLKELEALERITAKIDRLSVYGGLDGLLGELVKLRPPST